MNNLGIVMEKYKYEDLCTIERDEDGNIKMIKTNVNPLNEIIFNIALNIQKKLDEQEGNNNAYIRLGTLTGSKILSGRGPKIGFKISNMGNVKTDLKSEFVASGINQTLHRIYLEVTCKVVILTPFNTLEEEIQNKVLLAECVIIGNVPSTYYNLNGIEKENLIDIIE